MLTNNKSVFARRHGQKVNGMKADIGLKGDPKPAFCKSITIPFFLRPKVESEFDE